MGRGKQRCSQEILCVCEGESAAFALCLRLKSPTCLGKGGKCDHLGGLSCSALAAPGTVLSCGSACTASWAGPAKVWPQHLYFQTLLTIPNGGYISQLDVLLGQISCTIKFKRRFFLFNTVNGLQHISASRNLLLCPDSF